MLKSFKIFVSWSLLCFLILSFDIQDGNPIRHIIQLKHPGISLTESVERTLFELKNDNGITKEFYMNVETVVCGDSQCKIDTVRIYWDTLGIYDRLELPSDVDLEKAEGEHFNQADYDKLNVILANRNCSLKEVYKEEVVGIETTEGVEEIDGMSGATIILNTNDYVKGAVWTCYTLWHWTNGEIFSIIRNVSGKRLTSDALIEIYNKENTKAKIFALEQIIRREIYRKDVMDCIQKNAPSNDVQLTKLTIDYFENAPAAIYFKAMEDLLKGGAPSQRQLYLSSILKIKNQPSNSFLERLILLLPTWDDYQSINLFLSILENKKVFSSAINREVLSLLDNENFIIARRAFWYLQDNEESPQLQNKLEKFQFENKDRL